MELLTILKDEELPKEVAQPVEEITDEIKNFCIEMCTTMKLRGGIGLAAPQVGKMLRIITIDTNVYTNNNAHLCSIMINPEVLDINEIRLPFKEGCLSFPKKRKEVTRPTEVEVAWTNTIGERLTTRFNGLAARVILHELDHLNGHTMFDEEGYK